MQNWQPAAKPKTRPRGLEIDIWSIDLETPPMALGELRGLLTEEERGRADRFHFDRHRRRFTVRRAAMRVLLGAYLGEAPRSLVFHAGPKGKPALEGEADLVFNLTDSADLALLAVGEGQELGVDVECLERPRDAGRLVERFFSPEERRVYEGLPEQLKTDGFFRAWTSKEAYLKAIGTGLSVPLRESTVELDPRRPPAIHSIGDSRDAAMSWTLEAFAPCAGFVGALAIERPGNLIRGYRWSRVPGPGGGHRSERGGIGSAPGQEGAGKNSGQ